MTMFSGVLAAVMALVLGWHIRRSPAGRALLALRVVSACLLILAIINPALILNQSAVNKPKLMIFLAAGQSMQTKINGGRSRLKEAVGWLHDQRPAIERAADTDIAVIGERIRVLPRYEDIGDVTASGADLNPRESFEEMVRAAGADRVWLISDGVCEIGDILTARLAQMGVAVDVLGVGARQMETEINLGSPSAPDFVFLHSTFTVAAHVQLVGLAGQEVVFSLELADPSHPKGWRSIDVQRHRVIDAREDLALRFMGEARAVGPEHWRIAATAGSNRRVREFSLDAIREKYRILYLAGRPSSEYSYLRDFLKTSAHNELVSFVILRNPDNPSPAPDRELSLIPFPADQLFGSALPQFDLFILENFSAARFGLPAKYLEAVRSFVSSGGALLVKGGENAFSAGGYRGTPLEDILPIAMTSQVPDFMEGRFRPVPTVIEHPLVNLYDTPNQSRRAWESLPELEGWGRVASVKTQAVVFAHHPQAKTEDGSPLPIVAARQFGKGRVMLLNTDSTWRWRLGASSELETSEFYMRFWTRVMQYLTGELDISRVRFTRLTESALLREPVRLTLRLFDEQFSPLSTDEATVIVTHRPPGGGARELLAQKLGDGSYEITLTGLNEGTHRILAKARYRGKDWGHDEVNFQWIPRGDEPMNRDWLMKTAADSNGTYYDLYAAPVDDLLAQVRGRDATRRVQIEAHPFTSGICLAGIAVLMIMEWYLRRKYGHA